ncbi:MAG: hypothetical protein HW403_1006 [Dehalococcoidia bacterium]|nr:hypothetical protein [Dehalococcoidia bacterium]
MVPVTDLATAVAFYRDVLGMKLLWNETLQGHAAFDTSAVPLVLRAMGDGKGPESNEDTTEKIATSEPRSESVVVAFEIPDIHSTYRELNERGVHFLEEIDDHAGRLTVRFLDPFGNVMELNQSKLIGGTEAK